MEKCAALTRLDLSRLDALLKRGGALALAVENWTNIGIWIIGQSDAKYPKRWIDRLSKNAPPIIFGVGNGDLLSKGGVAILGSRDVSERGLAATRNISMMCVKNSLPVISGGARGVDTEAMLSAVESGGVTIGILADSLLKSAVDGKYRELSRGTNSISYTL